MPTGTSKPQRDDAVAVVRRLRDSGHAAYLAGGCVRDLLLGLEPADYDVATDAVPQRVRELFAASQAVGAAFGVILVRQGRSVIEVATFRSDGHYEDGRRPAEVRFATAQEDARRRDFTINGLFLDPMDNRVIDYVDGQKDIEARVIRAIGAADVRFEEDHLRLLRTVRFAARLDFRIDEATAAAVKRHAAQLARISPERIAEELRLMLTPPTRTRAWALLDELGLLAVIFRFLAPPGDRREEIFARVAAERPVPFGLALAAGGVEWLWRQKQSDLWEPAAAKRIAHAMRKALKISNEESDQTQDCVAGLAPLVAAAPPGVVALKRFLAAPTAALSRDLLEAVSGLLVDAGRVAWLRRELADLEKTDFAPPPLMTGDDLVAAGFAPGPLFKIVLHRVYDAQLEGSISTKDAAMALARAISAPGMPERR